MEKLKHRLSDYTKVFEENIKVSDLAEFDLCACQLNEEVTSVMSKMERGNYDILPIKDGEYIDSSRLEK